MMGEPYIKNDALGGPLIDLQDGQIRVYDERQNSRTAYVTTDDRQKAAQALAGDRYRVIHADAGEWRQIEAHAVERDRPEPVDPADVRVGDVVQIETPAWGVWGEVVTVGVANDGGPQWLIDFGDHEAWQWPTDDATVRVLRSAEPEPDPAQVQAIRQAYKQVLRLHLSDAEVKHLMGLGVRVVDADG